MTQLIACRFVQGLGLGAEIVVGYSTLTEFVPPKTRGRWLSMMAFLVVSGFPATALLGYLIIPNFGWRPMFIIAGAGSLVVWYLRKNLPESPRWLESQGRTNEAESLMQAIETEAAGGRALPPVVVPAPVPQVAATDLLRPLLLRLVVGCALGAYSSDAIGRRMSIIGASIVTILAGYAYARANAASDPAIVLTVGFILIVAIYVQTAILFGVYTPELFPTEIRLRANGICNTFGRGATVVSPFIVGALMANYNLPGVVWLMIGLVLVQIVVVWAWGVEPRNRGLEDVAAKA
jgi:putative MFS transporter